MINPDSSLVSPEGFWEPDIRYPKENTHGLSFSMSSLALFVYFYDDGNWKLKVERQESLMDVLTTALCPGWSRILVVE